MRRLYVDKEDTVSLQAVLERLKCAHNVGSFMDTHSGLFLIRKKHVAIRHVDSSLKRAIVSRTTATPAPSSTALVVLPPSPSVDLSISSPSSRMLTPPPSPPRRLGPVANTAIIWVVCRSHKGNLL
ncbi:uncharacterized protein PHALS_05116 [Plasmopara halstedii]|uniref:Uncharacterized protein n=1 Tax=Plasmopara halstedii TaxID=4781 RepID=A0A0P1B1X5_PLAHL|nr:uncharacterized protein PHALS_05116 [Plasmopara halstedii]CEG47780.1 hypothetical protein PHALS_05116 [Plasmopara halstedii]|eukprot:XP_024584149.1 hypothetical protein PHALS_05116 [Plasmopara halstedii]